MRQEDGEAGAICLEKLWGDEPRVTLGRQMGWGCQNGDEDRTAAWGGQGSLLAKQPYAQGF